MKISTIKNKTIKHIVNKVLDETNNKDMDNNSNNNVPWDGSYSDDYLNYYDNNNIFYIYMFYNYDWEVPFYIGKGNGHRYKSYSDRNKIIKAIFNHYDCEGIKLIEELTEKEAHSLEDKVKKAFLERGFPIMDFERKEYKRLQREGIERAKREGKIIGRPKIEKPENWDEIIGKWSKGEITAKKAMEIMELKRNSFYKLVRENRVKKIELRK